MLTVHNSIPAKVIPSPREIEVVTVEIMLKLPLILCPAYVPPHLSDSYFNSLLKYLDHLLYMSHYDKIIILGDFNFPDIDWDTLPGRSHHSDLFRDQVYKFNLSHCVSSPTHVMGNILDIVLTSTSDLVSNLLVHNGTSHVSHLPSDHSKITFSIPIYAHPANIKSQPHYLLDYSKTDWTGLTKYLLDYDFSPLYAINDLNTLWSYLKCILTKATQHFKPKVKINSPQHPK